MKRVLIPTDFTVGSLKMIQHALQHYEQSKIQVILFHLLELPTSITDLMFLRRKKAEYAAAVSKDFYEAVEVLKNRYSSRLDSIDIKFEYGFTLAWFKNFLEGNGIDAIVYPGPQGLEKVYKTSIDMCKLIRKSGYPLIEAPVVPRVAVAKTTIAELFPVMQ